MAQERSNTLGVLVSGRGSNLEAIMQAIEDGRLDADLRVVISNKPGAYALERASNRGIPAEVVASRQFRKDRQAFESAIHDVLQRYGVRYVALAGFMRLLSPWFVRQYPNRIVNIHPSLLPAFPGLDAQEQAYEHGVKVSGVTVHFVDEGLDSGPIIAQRPVPVLDDDDADRLSARILEQEHRLYPECLQLLLQNRLAVDGRHVRVRPAEDA